MTNYIYRLFINDPNFVQASRNLLQAYQTAPADAATIKDRCKQVFAAFKAHVNTPAIQGNSELYMSYYNAACTLMKSQFINMPAQKQDCALKFRNVVAGELLNAFAILPLQNITIYEYRKTAQELQGILNAEPSRVEFGLRLAFRTTHHHANITYAQRYYRNPATFHEVKENLLKNLIDTIHQFAVEKEELKKRLDFFLGTDETPDLIRETWLAGMEAIKELDRKAHIYSTFHQVWTDSNREFFAEELVEAESPPEANERIQPFLVDELSKVKTQFLLCKEYENKYQDLLAQVAQIKNRREYLETAVANLQKELPKVNDQYAMEYAQKLGAFMEELNKPIDLSNMDERYQIMHAIIDN